MATERVKTTKVVDKYEEYEICDRCGLEPDESLVPLYNDLRREKYVNEAEKPIEWASELLISQTERVGPAGIDPYLTYKFEVPAETGFVIESRPEPMVEVCEDCWEEMFGWRDEDA